MDRNAIVFVVSAPSGGGKGTILGEVFKRDDFLRHAVSATTRAPRATEVNGQHYHFLSEEQFRQRIADDQFVEWANVHGAHYGTLKSEIERILASGIDVVLELDIQGMRSITQERDDVVTIFILPPSMEVLEERLRNRGGLDEEQLRLRLNNAKEEIAAKKEYDHVILNDALAEAVSAFEAVLNQARESAKKHTK